MKQLWRERKTTLIVQVQNNFVQLWKKPSTCIKQPSTGIKRFRTGTKQPSTDTKQLCTGKKQPSTCIIQSN